MGPRTTAAWARVTGTWRTLGEGDRLVVVAAGLLGLAVIVGSVAALVRGWLPIADEAFMEMRVRDVPGQLPLLGVYSRFGWNHPGPVQFVLLALPYRLLGSSSAALLVGTLAGHLVAAWALLGIGRRIDPVAGPLLFTLAILSMLAAPADDLRTPWNPFVGLVASVLLVAVAWGVAERHRLASILLLPLSSVLVQVHLVNAFLVLGALVAAATLMWAHARAPRGPRVRELLVGAAVVALMWLPPLAAQMLGRPGAFSDLLANRSGDGAVAGMPMAVGAAADAFALVPTWARTSTWTQGFALSDLSLPVWLLVAVVGAALAVRRRDATFLRGFAVAGICLCAAVIGASQLRDGFFAYLLVAMRGAALAVIAIGLASIARSLPEGVRSRAVVAIGVVAACGALGIGVGQVRGDNPGSEYRPAIELLTDAVLGSAVADEPLAVSGSLYFEAVPALALQLERAGLDVALVEPELDLAVGAHRIAAPDDDRTLVRVGPLDSAEEARATGWTVLAEYEVFTDSERERIAELRDQIAVLAERYDRLISSGSASRAATNEVQREAVEVNGRLRDVVAGRVEVYVATRPHEDG